MNANDLHRRCQRAEAAVAEMKKLWDAAGGPRGGSFGRALLSAECVRLQAENARLEEELDRYKAWVAEIFRSLGLPEGDMGALENYILNLEVTNPDLQKS